MRHPAQRTLAALALLVAASPLAAQDLPFLLDLPVSRGRSAAVRYTPGSLDRAAHVQDRYSLLAADYSRWSGDRLPLLVVLLSREDWQGMGIRMPYGFPVRLPNGTVVLAAWGDAAMVELWRHLLAEGLPTLEGTPLRGTAEEAASLLITDLLGQVEAARGLLSRGGFGSPRPPLEDLLAHTVALTAVVNHDRERLAVLDEVFRQLAVAPAEIPGADASLGGWLRRQADAYYAARKLVERRGGTAAKLLLKLARRDKRRLTSAAVHRRFPELRPWLSTR